MSHPPRTSFTCSKAAMTCFSSVISTRLPKASPGNRSSKESTASLMTESSTTSVSSTLAPSSRNRSAIALPIPCVAPVTKTRFLLIPFMVISLLVERDANCLIQEHNRCFNVLQEPPYEAVILSPRGPSSLMVAHLLPPPRLQSNRFPTPCVRQRTRAFHSGRPRRPNPPVQSTPSSFRHPQHRTLLALCSHGWSTGRARAGLGASPQPHAWPGPRGQLQPPD